MVEWIIEPLGDAADLDGVLDVDVQSFTRPWTRAMYESEFLNRDTSRMFVLRTAGRPVAGYCAAWFVLDEIHINNIAVRPELRGQGLGIGAPRARARRGPRGGRLPRHARSAALERRCAAVVRAVRIPGGRRAPRLLHRSNRRRPGSLAGRGRAAPHSGRNPGKSVSLNPPRGCGTVPTNRGMGRLCPCFSASARSGPRPCADGPSPPQTTGSGPSLQGGVHVC